MSVPDFGQSAYPAPYEKKLVSPRILLVSTWTDGKYGLPGGRAKKGEDVFQAMNREFLEEIGTDVNFTENDFCYSVETSDKIVYNFAKITDDQDFFQSLLINFHRQERPAYVDEIIGVVGFPIWIEGPLDGAQYSWNNNIWGFPRHLCYQGGTFSPTLQSSYAPRESIILILLMKEVIPSSLMKRVFELTSILCHHHPESCIPLESFDSFLAKVGIVHLSEEGENASQCAKKARTE